MPQKIIALLKTLVHRLDREPSISDRLPRLW